MGVVAILIDLFHFWCIDAFRPYRLLLHSLLQKAAPHCFLVIAAAQSSVHLPKGIHCRCDRLSSLELIANAQYSFVLLCRSCCLLHQTTWQSQTVGCADEV